jgi:hypothetical protein
MYMKKILTLTLFLLTLNAVSSDTVATITYTDGIDEGTDTLLPTSDWRLEVSPDYETTCSEIASDLKFHKTTLVPVTSYIDRNLECNDIVHPGFESEGYITWVDFGYDQKAEFGIENITCPIYGQCEMDRVVNTSDKSFANITLENGEHGTRNGTAKIFAMRLGSLSIQSIPGLGGEGGRNDLLGVAPETRYCVKVQDATTIDATEESSKTPYATVQAYNWTPISSGDGGANGVDAPPNRRVDSFEGVSPTALKRLEEAYLQ